MLSALRVWVSYIQLRLLYWNDFLDTDFRFLVQAIDPRTRMVLFKMLNRGVFDNINGCISTGKEVT
jgi:serine/threonine-protein kinase RIO1